MNSADSIETLVAKAARGNAESCEHLYKKLVQPVFAFVQHRTATRDVAKELTQDSLAALFLALPRFRYQSDAAFYAFLFTIVRRQLAKYYESSSVQATETLTEDEADKEGNDSEVLDVSRALSALDETAREIVVLHHWSRYTFSEIATILNMKEEAVRVRHHRAKALLKETLTR